MRVTFPYVDWVTSMELSNASSEADDVKIIRKGARGEGIGCNRSFEQRPTKEDIFATRTDGLPAPCLGSYSSSVNIDTQL